MIELLKLRRKIMILENNLYNAEESNIFLKGEAKSKFRTLVEEKKITMYLATMR